MLACPDCKGRLARTKIDRGAVYCCEDCDGRAVNLAVVRRSAGQVWVRCFQARGQMRLPSGLLRVLRVSVVRYDD